MKKIKFYAHLIVCGFVWQGLIVFQLIAYAGVSIGETIDCTDVSVDYRDDLTLTQEERLRLMDEAFLQSLNRFELCQSAKKMKNASGEAGIDGNGTEGGSGGLTGNSGGTSPGSSPGGPSQDSTSIGESVAGSTMSGTDAPQNIPSAGEIEASGELKSSQDPKGQNEAGNNTYGKKEQSNGKLPEDIPPAQNDDALAAQIRYAAENETDPVKAKQLWNEYRKYKGLPTK